MRQLAFEEQLHCGCLPRSHSDHVVHITQLTAGQQTSQQCHRTHQCHRTPVGSWQRGTLHVAMQSYLQAYVMKRATAHGQPHDPATTALLSHPPGDDAINHVAQRVEPVEPARTTIALFRPAQAQCAVQTCLVTHDQAQSKGKQCSTVLTLTTSRLSHSICMCCDSILCACLHSPAPPHRHSGIGNKET